MKYPLVEIKWLDHVSCDSCLDLENAKVLKPAEVISVGFLLNETSEYLICSATIDTTNSNSGQTFSIIRDNLGVS